MNDTISFLDRLAWDVAWQASVCLAVGLVAGVAWRRHAARAHLAIALAVAASIVAPVCTAAVRSLGWGLVAVTSVDGTNARAADLRPATSDVPRASDVEFGRVERMAVPPSTRVGIDSGRAERIQKPRVALVATSTPSHDKSVQRATAVAIRTTWPSIARWLVVGWAVLSMAALVRLGVSVVASRRLLCRAYSVSNEAIRGAVAAAAERLSVRAPVEILASDELRCPAVWCWRRRPRLLLPADALDAMVVDEQALRGIVCHELAHWKRRDHLASFLARLVCCVLPWHPLAHGARRRIDELAERACDEWAVASGHDAIDYAQSLLSLVPERRAKMALAAVGGRGTLKRRVRHLLSVAMVSPRVGARWTVAAAAVMLLTVVAFALAQERRVTAAAEPAVEQNKQSADERVKEQALTIRGVVRDSEDKPVAGAKVWLVGREAIKPTEARNVSRFDTRVVPLDSTTSDRDGAFAFEVEQDLAPYTPRVEEYGIGLYMAARAEGLALACSERITDPSSAAEKTTVIRLEETATIEGQLFTIDGQPLVGATVEAMSLSGGPDDESTWHFSVAASLSLRSQTAPFWPSAVATDAGGRFRIEGLCKTTSARLRVRADSIAPQTFDVVTAAARQRIRRVWEKSGNVYDPSHELDTPFTYVVESPLAIEGKVTNQLTGETLAGAEIHIEGSRYGAGPEALNSSATGHDGAFRLLVEPVDFYTIRVYPPKGYVGFERSPNGDAVARRHLTDGAFRLDVRLAPAPLVRGRVVDGDTGQPLAGATVSYQPAKGNAARRPLYNLDDSVLTDEKGEFVLTGLRGQGFVMVEGPSKDYLRVHVSREQLKRDYDALPHGIHEVDATNGSDQEVGEIYVRRGVTLSARAVGPSGEPLPSVQVGCIELGALQNGYAFFEGSSFKDGLVEIPGLAPGRRARLFFYSKELSAGAVAELTAQIEPAVVRLEPTATIRGRLVHANGEPAPDIVIFPKVYTFADEVTAEAFEGGHAAQRITFYTNHFRDDRNQTRTDTDGRFELFGILADAPMYLSTNYELADGTHGYFVGKLESGEVRDLGDITLRN